MTEEVAKQLRVIGDQLNEQVLQVGLEPVLVQFHFNTSSVETKQPDQYEVTRRLLIAALHFEAARFHDNNSESLFLNCVTVASEVLGLHQ